VFADLAGLVFGGRELMMSQTQTAFHRTFISDFRRNFLAGLFALIPLMVTIYVVKILFDLLSRIGDPIVEGLKKSLEAGPQEAARAAQLIDLSRYVISITLTVLLIYLLGWMTNRVLGRKLINLFEGLLDRIPVVKHIYGLIKQFLAVFKQKPDGVERVVLINFPNSQMKSMGLVMKTFNDVDSGRELVAVYIPTALNPTCGYLEVLPVEDVTNTTWTVDEAMRFIVSGGSIGPDTINFDRSAVRPLVEAKVDSGV